MAKLIIENQDAADAYYDALKELMIRWEFYYSTKRLCATLVHEISIMDIIAALDEFEHRKYAAVGQYQAAMEFVRELERSQSESPSDLSA